MGFYFKRSISSGPFRFNLSRSGLGMSVGVKGLRFGTGPRGNYVHMGRGGLYYRKYFGNGQKNNLEINVAHHEDFTPEPYVPIGSTNVETGNILDMKPINGSDILTEINEKMSLMQFWPWVAGIGLLFFFISLPDNPLLTSTIGILTLAISILAYRFDEQRKTVVLMYDVEDSVLKSFEFFTREFDTLASTLKIWNIQTGHQTNDWKRHAGASHLLSRTPIQLINSTPKIIKANIGVPCMHGGRRNLFFLPDLILIQDDKKVGAVAYEDLMFAWHHSIYVEEEAVPADAKIVGQTWRFINKDGGPDRRFKNNRRIPTVLYQYLGLQGPGGFQKMLQFSHVADRSSFNSALLGLRKTIINLKQLPSVDS